MSTTDSVLRFITAGSVDDGKSTLIGRLLYDSQALLADQVAQLNKRSAGGTLDLASLTDGLEAEREQGITIDVAYRYFSTQNANSSSPTPQGTSNTPAIWSQARLQPMRRLCW